MKHDRNRDGVHDAWSYIGGCLEHLQKGVGCIGSLLNADSPEMTGATMIPSTAELIQKMFPSNCTRDFLFSMADKK